MIIFVSDKIIDVFDPIVSYSYEDTGIRNRIAHKKAFLDRCRPISPAIIDRLKDDFTVEWTYNSNHIEGNTLTVAETKMILSDGITIGGKTLREHFEVVNHQKAISYLEELVDQQSCLRSIDLLNIHGLVLHNIMDEFAGRIRQGMVRIIGANFTPPNAGKVSGLLDELVSYVNNNPSDFDIVTLASVFHHRFVWIHPFVDGNGRTARLAMNIILLRSGYPPAYILTKDRNKYINALNRANTGDYSKLTLMMHQAVERSLNLYILAIGGEYEDYEPTQTIAQDPEIPYGQEYLSLLARRGRIDAYKEGRIWLTTKSAVKEYRLNKLK